jgi:integrase
MCWVPKSRLWRKVYRGKVYTISCRQLRQQGYEFLDDTSAGSYLAANSWWNKKEHELWEEEKKGQRQPTALEQLALAYNNVPPEQWLEALRKNDETHNPPESEPRYVLPELLASPNDELKRLLTDNLQAALMKFLNQTFLKGEPLPEHLAQLLPRARFQQLTDSVKGIRGQAAVEPDRTLKAHAEAWLARQQRLAEAGQMTPARAANNRTCLQHFLGFLGPESDVDGIDAGRWDSFYLWLLSPDRCNAERGTTWSVAYRKDVLWVARAFVRWLWEKELIERPRNLDQKLKVGPAAKMVRTWTREDFGTAVREAPGKLKLAILMMANCGMTQRDLADLRKDEVNWTEGRVTRKRSKTKGHANVPTVNYPLWPVTFELLRKFCDQGPGELVLLTAAGRAFIRHSFREDGGLSRTDGFVSHFKHLRRRLQKKGVRLGPLKELRKLGATLLGGHATYNRFRDYFLGHSPGTMAERHYDAKSDEFRARFDEAVLWLGRELGQVGAGEAGPTDVERGPGSDL